jgi:hypothetical protein
MMAEQPKAQGGGDRKSEEYHRGTWNPSGPEVPTLSSQGIDKNLAHCAMTSKRVDADWWDMHAEVGLLLVGLGTAITLVALIGLIWSMVPPR